MFKYKLTPFILIILVLLVFFFLKNSWSKEKSKSDKLLLNNVKFSGVITDLKISRNHAFGIIKLKIDNANTKLFSSAIENDMFPYKIKDSVAEIYHYVSHELKKGVKVELDSDKKTVTFFDKDKLLYSSDISIITEETDIKFIKENTSTN